eukprot:CAMPEP_0197189550 /NCGR_PEP_ID=MMETSP1423-20130617/19959_1 /TAXON_ID=476441 /ORGANISM="Pseudo-nitzschia heimii, Strain UNC1101" /LENGTH=1052 /DNA_ID=CAMNT_0042641691 /DNA_START=139 /DNA_END=3297 /DNA_ORIENTATION=-
MPAIYLFGRRSLLGGDDLHVPALAAATVRIIQVTCLVLPLLFYVSKQSSAFLDYDTHDDKYRWPLLNYLLDWWDEADGAADAEIEGYDGPPACAESAFARYYPLLSFLHLTCTVLFCLHSLSLEYRIWHWSCQGTPTKRQPRTKNVQELIEKKIGICTITLAFIVGSTYYVAAFCFARPYHRCFDSILSDPDGGDGEDGQSIVPKWVGSTSWYVLGALLATSQTVEVVLAALFYAQLKGSEQDALSGENGMRGLAPRSPVNSVHHKLMEELWADRCQVLFRCLSFSTCFLFGGRDLANNNYRNDAYRHVAQALADYFETNGTLDVVPTDMFTGLMVLQKIQRLRRLRTRRKVCKESTLLRSASARSNLGNGTRDPEISPPMGLGNGSLESSIDNSYHEIISPDAKTGLRSRVASSADMSSRSQSPNPARMISDSGTSKLPEAPRSASPGPSSISVMEHDASFIKKPTHQQQAEGIQRQNIFRRKEPEATPNINYDSQYSFYRTTARKVLNPLDPFEAAVLEEGARMCKYALSIYTWMLYIFAHPITGFPRLACPCGPKTSTSSCFRKCCDLCGNAEDRSSDSRIDNGTRPSASMPLFAGNESNTDYANETTVGALTIDQETHSRSGSSGHSSENNGRSNNDIGLGCLPGDEHNCGSPMTSGDNICGWNKKALLMVAGIPEADLVYAEFNSKVRSVPYCILLDHEHSHVVLSIRGSLSLEDIVTDALILPKTLEGIGNQYGFDGRDQFCHAGVVACFENVMKDLDRHRLLERLLGQQFPGYSLRIVGHSLGAGVVSLLGYALRPKYPSLKVYAYSPPGGTMTWDMATGCKDFLTSFVLDNDIVPRLSVSCLEDLRDQVLELIGRIKVSKHQVFQKFMMRRNNQHTQPCHGGSNHDGSISRIESIDDYEDELEELTEIVNEILDDDPSDTLYSSQLEEFRRVQRQRRASRGETSLRKLYPPGKMIHLIKTGQEDGYSHTVKRCLTCKTSNSGFFYTPVYISNDDLDEIVVSSTMGSDHFIDRMYEELRTLSDKFFLENRGRDGVANAYPCGLGA